MNNKEQPTERDECEAAAAHAIMEVEFCAKQMFEMGDIDAVRAIIVDVDRLSEQLKSLIWG